MPKAKPLNVVFDGVNDVENGFGGSDSFFGGFMWVYDPGPFSKFTATLTGSNWNVFSLHAINWGNPGLKAVISDADAGAGRGINVLNVGYNSKVDLISTSVTYLEGQAGARHDVTLGSGNYRTVTLSADTNIVKTGSGFVETIHTYGADKIYIGSGGAHSVLTGDGGSTVKTSDGGVGSIRTGAGNDKIFTNGSVGTISAGAGDDIVTTRSQYITNIHLGAGDDKLVVAKMGAWYELRVQGSSNPKNGVDTLDFSKLEVNKRDDGTVIKTGVTIKIGSSGEWQEIYKTTAIDAFVSETGMENVIGTKFRDFLSSGSKDNELTGGKGKDVFIFGKNTGNDTIMDFEVGKDIIRIKGHNGGFDALEIVGGNIVLNGGTIDLMTIGDDGPVDLDAATLTVDSFQFL